jgi:CubicO group peptidase (beta-lactamase class C family)
MPERWQRAERQGHDVITGPEGLVTLKILESAGGDLPQAVERAWANASPDMKLKERSRNEGTPNDRFEDQLVVTYTDDKNERVAQAIALLHKDGQHVYVLLVEGPLKEMQKRSAELNRIVSSIEVAGATRVEVKAADAKPLNEARRKELFAFVDKARQQIGLPGVALAIVSKEGTFTRGFGTVANDSKQRVDADTRFMIGSITKSFSTLLMATLVDEGKFDWETPVQQVYPAFRLADPKLSKQIQMGHLFCACVGAPRQDMELLFSFKKERAADTLKQVADMKLTTTFGETFQYNNQLTAAGGFIAGQASFPKERDLDRGFSKALQTRVLDKLGMKRSTLDNAAVERGNNFAYPHGLDAVERTQKRDMSLELFVRPIAPAGALWSSANDMARYVKMQLGRGALEGKRVVSEKNLARTQTAQISVADKTGYGMGWLIGKYRGVAAIEHSGGTIGFSSNLVFFPELDLGLFVVTNRNVSVGFHGFVQRRMFELMFDAVEPRAERDLTHSMVELDKELGKQASMVTELPLPKSVYGRYRSKLLGDMKITAKGKGAVMDVGEWKAAVAVYAPKERADTLVLADGPLQGLLLHQEEREGKPVLVLKHSQTDYVFEKRL